MLIDCSDARESSFLIMADFSEFPMVPGVTTVQALRRHLLNLPRVKEQCAVGLRPGIRPGWNHFGPLLQWASQARPTIDWLSLSDLDFF
jgi:hypothetical protein